MWSDQPGDDGLDAVSASALAARDGDAQAARAFVAATQHEVWRLLAHLSDRTVAEDLAQETYERAFGALPRFRGDASARTWLLGIARRVAADHLRRARRRPQPGGPVDDGALGPAVAAPGDHAERVVLDTLLDLLDPVRREAFVLTQVIGLDYRDAAAVIGCPIGTIRSRVARARADLVAAVDAGGHARTG